MLAAAGGAADTDRSVVLGPEQARSIVRQCSRDAPEKVAGGWTPAPAVIAGMEARIREIEKLTSRLCCGKGRSVKDISAYRLQYAGIVVAGRRLIYINAFRYATRGWKTRPVIACDGGDSFWGALYDPKRRRFFALAFNGVS